MGLVKGAHAIIYSRNAEADRALFKDVLGLPSVDAGRGWLIFGLPSAEVAFHPAERAKPGQELYLLCDDIEAAVANLKRQGVTVEPQLYDQPWGHLAFIRLPGGGKLGIYEPRHPRPRKTARVSARKPPRGRTAPRDSLGKPPSAKARNRRT